MLAFDTQCQLIVIDEPNVKARALPVEQNVLQDLQWIKIGMRRFGDVIRHFENRELCEFHNRNAR